MSELDCRYGIQLKNHQLVLTNAKYNDTKITLMERSIYLQIIGGWTIIIKA